MADAQRLASLIRRVPVLRVDTRAAEPVERCAAVSYARDMAKWLSEARIALDGLSHGGRGVESRALGELEPDGELPSELVPRAIFPPGAC